MGRSETNLRLRSGTLDATRRGAAVPGDAKYRAGAAGGARRPDPRPEPRRERSPVPLSERSPVPRIMSRPEPRPEPRVVSRPEPRPEPRVVSRPGTLPEPRPLGTVGKFHVLNALRGNKAFSKFFIILIIIFTIILLVSVTPIFSISEIIIEGNNYYDSDHIIANSGLRIGQNGFSALAGNNIIKIFALRCTAAEQAVASACPYVKTVQARYVLPRSILIDIEERSKSFIAPYFGSGLLVDGEGVVVDIVKNYKDSELPVAQGLSVAGYEIGKLLAVGDEAQIDTVLSVINAVRQADRDSDEVLAWNVDTIDISDLRNIIIAVNNGISVNLGDGTELYYRVSAAKEIIARGIEEGSEGSIIFKNGARPVFVPGAGIIG